jgi:hypothetical protein
MKKSFRTCVNRRKSVSNISLCRYVGLYISSSINSSNYSSSILELHSVISLEDTPFDERCCWLVIHLGSSMSYPKRTWKYQIHYFTIYLASWEKSVVGGYSSKRVYKKKSRKGTWSDMRCAFHNMAKVYFQIFFVHVMKSCRESKSTASLILNLGTR